MYANVRSISGRARSYNVVIVDLICPHCGDSSTAEGPMSGRKYALILCMRCHKGIMIYDASNIQVNETLTDYYPKGTPTVNQFVPKDIGEDYIEAQRCFEAGAWHGCAVMARRCMHSVAEHFKATGKDLHEQIKDLQTKQIIPPALAERAQHVRVLGKHGAHPYDTRGNELKDLRMHDARSALDFCGFIFNEVFIQPERIKQSKARLTP
jgi:hypothetical protein